MPQSILHTLNANTNPLYFIMYFDQTKASIEIIGKIIIPLCFSNYLSYKLIVYIVFLFSILPFLHLSHFFPSPDFKYICLFYYFTEYKQPKRTVPLICWNCTATIRCNVCNVRFLKLFWRARLFIGSTHARHDKVAYILKNQNTEGRWNDCQDVKKRYRGPRVYPDARRKSMATTLYPVDHSSSLIHAERVCVPVCARVATRRYGCSRVLNASRVNVRVNSLRKASVSWVHRGKETENESEAFRTELQREREGEEKEKERLDEWAQGEEMRELGEAT